MTDTSYSTTKRSPGDAVRALGWYRQFRNIVLMSAISNIDKMPPASAAAETTDKTDENTRESAEDDDARLGIVGAVVGLFVLLALLGGDDTRSTRRTQPF